MKQFLNIMLNRSIIKLEPIILWALVVFGPVEAMPIPMFQHEKSTAAVSMVELPNGATGFHRVPVSTEATSGSGKWGEYADRTVEVPVSAKTPATVSTPLPKKLPPMPTPVKRQPKPNSCGREFVSKYTIDEMVSFTSIPWANQSAKFGGLATMRQYTQQWLAPKEYRDKIMPAINGRLQRHDYRELTPDEKIKWNEMRGVLECLWEKERGPSGKKPAK